MQRERGFTLLEMIMVLAIMATLAAIVVPLLYRRTIVVSEDAVNKTMNNFKKVMIGDPELTSNGVRMDFGYIGDWGGLPATLDNLFFAQTPLWSFDAAKKVGAGWNGPYLTGNFSGDSTWFKIDEWNNEYVYSTDDYVNAEGNAVDGKIVSPGPDKSVGTTDDLIIEILKIETTSTVYGYAYDSDGNPMQNIPITIYYPKNGSITQNTVFSDALGLYTFNSIPFGIRSIYI
jgi:prepilin-type N-terminal cleavage/methylation domain-containing protein